MGLNDTVLEMVSAIQPELYWVFLKLGVAAIIVIILKKIFENVASYYMFRWNKHLGSGVRVNVGGKEGVIENYDRSSIYVKIEGGDTLIIPISRWRVQTWIVKDFTEELIHSEKK